MIDLKKIKRNFLISHTLFTLLAGLIGSVILKNISTEHYFDSYPVIPTYFFIVGLGCFYLLMFCYKHAPQKLLILYLAVKVIKMLSSIFILVIYCCIAKENVHVFLLTFVTFYLVYLIFETWFFFSFELKLIGKKNIKNKK